MSPKSVFVLSTGGDTGGQGARIAKAFTRHAPGWKVRAMHATDNYLQFTRDLKWDREMAQRLYSEADVVHHKNQLHGYQWFEDGSNKPAVMHHHGSRLRNNSESVTTEAQSIGASNVVSTVDLVPCMPGSEWLPSIFELEEVARYRRRNRGGPLIIAHAPTDRAIKGTETIIAAVEKLRTKYDLEFDLIEMMPWKVCLSRKGRADIFIDQLGLGYGNNAIEAWAMGIPVICGVESQSVRARMVRAWGELPFYRATPTTLMNRLEDLIRSRELREEWGQRGRAHVEKYHAAPVVVEQLKRIYQAAQPSKGIEHLRLARTGGRS